MELEAAKPDGVPGGPPSTTAGEPCGAEANAAKYLAAEAAFKNLRDRHHEPRAAWGYAKEFPRGTLILRESLITRIRAGDPRT